MQCHRCQLEFEQTKASPNSRLCANCEAIGNSIPEVTFLSSEDATIEALREERKTSESRRNSPTPEQTVASARALTRAWRDTHREQVSPSEKKFRIDSAHSLTEPEPDRRPPSPAPPADKSLASARGAILFGLFLFLGGKVTTLWAFLVGNVFGWAIGSLISIGGITFALLSIQEMFKRMEARLEEQASSSVRPSRSRKSGKAGKKRSISQNF